MVRDHGRAPLLDAVADTWVFGAVPGALDLDLTLDALYGALYMRFLIRQSGLTEVYVDEVVGLVMDGAGQNRRR